MVRINFPCKHRPVHPPKSMESLQLLIPTQLDALLAQRAVQDGQTKTDIVRAALESYLAPQTPLERSLQKIERTLGDRFDRLEKLVRQDLRPNVRSGYTDSGYINKDTERSAGLSAPAISTRLPEVSQAFDADEDEPDEILPEFLEFASPAVQHHLDVFS